MAYLQKKTTKYSTYYVVAESKRVNGKPRVVNQWYLGTIDKLKEIAQGNVTKDEPREIVCQEHGSVTALFKIAEDIGIRQIVDKAINKRRQGMTVGDYVLIAALNRAIAATSKTKVSEWVESTTLSHLMKLDSKKLSSQNFWDNFDKIDATAVEQIGDAVAKNAVEMEKIPLDCLVYDTTNYFNFWDVTNPSKLARMTKSKAGKNHLRHIGLALAVDRDYGLPLFHRLYSANTHDSKVFSDLLGSMYEQIKEIVSDKKGLTLIFDKGNNSEAVIESLDESRHHFIGSRSPYHHKELCRTALDEFQEIELDDEQKLLIFEAKAELYGHDRRLIVTHNEATFRRQLHRLERNIARAKEELSMFKRKAKGADGRATIDSIMRQGDEILTRFHVTGLVKIEVEETEEGFQVSARQDFPAIEDAKTRFGKQVLFTNRETLSVEDIINYYRDRNVVEEAFRITKSDQWVKWEPAFHWTDSKIRIHALTCVIALLLVRIAHKRARAAGFEPGADRMMELIRGIKSAMYFYPQSAKAHRKTCRLSSDQHVLATALKIPIS